MSPEERDILLGFDHDMAAVDDKDMNRAMDQLRRIRNNLIPAPSKNPNLAVGTEFKAWVNLICVRHRRRILERRRFDALVIDEDHVPTPQEMAQGVLEAPA